MIALASATCISGRAPFAAADLSRLASACAESISSTDNHCGLSLEQLSESERFRFSIAFQLALATATGIRFLVIDRADVLDRARRKLLTGLLVNSDLDQAIVLATGEEPPPLAVPQGVRFWDLAKVQRQASEQGTDGAIAPPIQAELLVQQR